MTGSLPVRVLAAAAVLEELQADPVTFRDSYSPQDLRNIIHMWEGSNER